MEELQLEDIPAPEPAELIEPIPENIPERKKTEKRVIVEEDDVDKPEEVVPAETPKKKKKKKKLSGVFDPFAM